MAELVLSIEGRRERERDDELLHPAPSLRSLLSHDEDPRLRIEERLPILRPSDGDDLEEVREGEESDGFGDGEEGGRRRGGGSFSSTCWDEAELDNPLDKLDGESVRKGGHGGWWER